MADEDEHILHNGYWEKADNLHEDTAVLGWGRGLEARHEGRLHVNGKGEA
jgi:hypothetical protein